jgi:phospholipase C
VEPFVNPQQRSDDPIKHAVLLMFENHSFDQMLGCFKQVYPELEGVDPAHPHVNRDRDGKEFKQELTTERQMLLDPRHEVNHVAVQMEDHNGGFIKDFIDANYDGKQPPQSLLEKQCHFVMGYYPLEFLPALHGLACEFLICDHWYSSLPGPTWPNRFFALTGTSLGRVNMPEDGEHTVDFQGWFQQDQTTIFDRLSEKGASWKVYFHDIPQTVCLLHQRRPENAARYFPITEFHKDAGGQEAEFPAFAFIEPDYNGITENDDHPPHDVMKAQKLLADVYNSIRSNADLWASTLLVVLYDEHGGFYDNVEPPPAIPPDHHKDEYTFDRFGIRVPAVLVSPWVAMGFNPTQFDHTSLLKYLIDKWQLGPLGNRTANANSIEPLILKGTPRTDTVKEIKLTQNELEPPDADLEKDAVAYLSGHHRALALLGQHLMAELDEDIPRWYSWLARLYEALKQRLFAKAATPETILANYQATKAQCSTFLNRRKQQAIPRLAAKIQDSQIHEDVRRHAAETLGYVINVALHREPDPVRAAQQWLQEHGRLPRN